MFHSLNFSYGFSLWKRRKRLHFEGKLYLAASLPAPSFVRASKRKQGIKSKESGVPDWKAKPSLQLIRLGARPAQTKSAAKLAMETSCAPLQLAATHDDGPTLTKDSLFPTMLRVCLPHFINYRLICSCAARSSRQFIIVYLVSSNISL